MLVEFVGCTGSGKTTICAEVVECLANLGVNIRQMNVGGRIRFDFVSFPWFIVFALRNRGLCRLAVRTLFRDADSRFFALNLFRNFAKKMGMYELLRRRSANEHIVWDEGSVHAFHNLFVHVNASPRPEDIAAFAKLVPKPDLVIYVRAPLDVMVARTLERGHGRVPSDEESVRRFIAHAHAGFEKLALLAPLRERLLVVGNNGGIADMKTAATKTAEEIGCAIGVCS